MLVPCVFLLTTEVLLVWVAAAVLDLLVPQLVPCVRYCQDLAGSYQDLTGSCQYLTGSCQDITESCQDLTGSYWIWLKSRCDPARSFRILQDLPKSCMILFKILPRSHKILPWLWTGVVFIFSGSRGPAGVSCYSSNGFSFCLSCFPVY